MGYILVQPEVLRAKGINYFETIPDGRAIAEMRMLKVLGSMSQVDIISSAKELKKLIADQIAAGINTPSPEDEMNPGEGESVGVPLNPDTSDGEPFVPEEAVDAEMPSEELPESDETEQGDSVQDNSINQIMEEMTNGNE